MQDDQAYAIIPTEFFIKEKAEETMMEIAQSVKAYRHVRRGDPHIFEPDFVADGDQGIEMTIASYDVQNTTLIHKLRNYDYKTQDIEADTIASIMAALGRKAKKKYCLKKIDVVVTDILPFRVWYEPVDTIDDVGRLNRRNAMYRAIFEQYILTNVFTNVFIIMTGDYGEIIVFDVKAHETGGRHIYRLKFSGDATKWPFCVSKKVYEQAAKKQDIRSQIKKAPPAIVQAHLRGKRK